MFIFVYVQSTNKFWSKSFVVNLGILAEFRSPFKRVPAN